MKSISELEILYSRLSSDHNEVKDKIKNRLHYASREQALVWRRQKRNLWNELRDIKRQIELLQK